jgi:hypothetical protein
MNGREAARQTFALKEKMYHMAHNVPRRPEGQRRYTIDYIPDKTLFKAVMFARKMIREGRHPGVANRIAANYYKVETADVAQYVGQAGGTTRHRRRS